MKRLKIYKIFLAVSGLVSISLNTFAQPVTSPVLPKWYEKPEAIFIVLAIIFLLLAIYAMAMSTSALSKAIAKAGKKSSIIIFLLLISLSCFSQETAAPVKSVSPQFPAWAEEPSTYIFGGLFVIMIITLIVLYKANTRLAKILAPEQQSQDPVQVKLKKQTFTRKIYLRLVDTVPVTKETDILLDHDYDGIRELDNNLPPWWKYGFYVTIIFSVLYMFIYHVSGTGKLQEAEYKQELAVAQKEKEERLKSNAENVTEENVVVLSDEAQVGQGKATFEKLCAACHRTDGGGQVGPNLTDEYWLHGGGIKNIFKTITYGVPDKGMISWQSQLSPKQIQQVATYVISLKGTNPAGAKEAQGNKWEETISPVDSIANVAKDSLKVATK